MRILIPEFSVSLSLSLSLSLSEDCADCLGTQKKDDSNDREKKEDEEAVATSVHHSIIEMWDWGRQPGGWRLSLAAHLWVGEAGWAQEVLSRAGADSGLLVL